MQSHEAFDMTLLDALDITRVQLHFLLVFFPAISSCACYVFFSDLLYYYHSLHFLWHADSIIFSTLFAPCMALFTRILNAVHTDTYLRFPWSQSMLKRI